MKKFVERYCRLPRRSDVRVAVGPSRITFQSPNLAILRSSAKVRACFRLVVNPAHVLLGDKFCDMLPVASMRAGIYDRVVQADALARAARLTGYRQTTGYTTSVANKKPIKASHLYTVTLAEDAAPG